MTPLSYSKRIIEQPEGPSKKQKIENKQVNFFDLIPNEVSESIFKISLLSRIFQDLLPHYQELCSYKFVCVKWEKLTEKIILSLIDTYKITLDVLFDYSPNLAENFLLKHNTEITRFNLNDGVHIRSYESFSNHIGFTIFNDNQAFNYIINGTKIKTLNLAASKITGSTFRNSKIELPNIVSLKIGLMGTYEDLAKIGQCFVSLKKLSCYGKISGMALSDALKKYFPNLKSLSISIPRSDLKDAETRVENLEILKVSCSSEISTFVNIFPDLKYLKYHREHVPNAQDLSDNSHHLSLQTFDAKLANDDQIVTILKKFPNLKKLIIESKIDGSDIICQELGSSQYPNLESLYIGSPYFTHKGLQAIAQHFPNLKELDLEYLEDEKYDIYSLDDDHEVDGTFDGILSSLEELECLKKLQLLKSVTFCGYKPLIFDGNKKEEGDLEASIPKLKKIAALPNVEITVYW